MTSAYHGNTGNLLEFLISPGNLLEFNWCCCKFLTGGTTSKEFSHKNLAQVQLFKGGDDDYVYFLMMVTSTWGTVEVGSG